MYLVALADAKLCKILETRQRVEALFEVTLAPKKKKHCLAGCKKRKVLQLVQTCYVLCCGLGMKRCISEGNGFYLSRKALCSKQLPVWVNGGTLCQLTMTYDVLIQMLLHHVHPDCRQVKTEIAGAMITGGSPGLILGLILGALVI